MKNIIILISISRIAFFIGLPLIIVYIHLSVLALITSLEGDAVSRVLPATALLNNLGAPYKDYWEIAPPGIFMLLMLWSKLFGISLISFKVLQIIFVFLSSLFILMILSRVVNKYLLVILGFIILFLNFSPALFTIFLPTELFGLTFSLAGLTILIYRSKIKYHLFLATFLFIFSGQMKDPFGLTILAILPTLIWTYLIQGWKFLIRDIIQVFLGIFTAISLILIYLISVNALFAYQQVIQYKSEAFDIDNYERFTNQFVYTIQMTQNIFINFQYLVIVPILMWLVFKITKLVRNNELRTKNLQKDGLVFRLNFNVTSKSFNKIIVLFYCIGSFIGFSAGGNFGSHYIIQAVSALFLLWGILWDSIMNATISVINNPVKRFIASFSILVISFVFLAPKPAFFKEIQVLEHSPKKVYNQFASPIDEAPQITRYISEHFSKDECILSVYGWGVGQTYFYSQTRPCTRFFLPNIVNQDWQKREYKNTIFENPPAAIVYTEDGADMNIKRFEKEVINLSSILAFCYKQDLSYKDLYLPKVEKGRLKECITVNSQ